MGDRTGTQKRWVWQLLRGSGKRRQKIIRRTAKERRPTERGSERKKEFDPGGQNPGNARLTEGACQQGRGQAGLAGYKDGLRQKKKIRRRPRPRHGKKRGTDGNAARSQVSSVVGRSKNVGLLLVRGKHQFRAATPTWVDNGITRERPVNRLKGVGGGADKKLLPTPTKKNRGGLLRNIIRATGRRRTQRRAVTRGQTCVQGTAPQDERGRPGGA